jgi:hypothetical protein
MCVGSAKTSASRPGAHVFGTSSRILMHSPGARVFSGLLPGGPGHAMQCNYEMYVCNDANECICTKVISEGRHILHPAKMIVVFERRLRSMRIK